MDDHERLGELRGVRVIHSAEPGITILGDSTRLKQVVLNLGAGHEKFLKFEGTRGDKVRFVAANPGGKLTITQIEAAK